MSENNNTPTLTIVNDTNSNLNNIYLEVNKVKSNYNFDLDIDKSKEFSVVAEEFEYFTLYFTVDTGVSATIYGINLDRNHWFSGQGPLHYIGESAQGTYSQIKLTVINIDRNGRDFKLRLNYDGITSDDTKGFSERDNYPNQ